MEPKISEGERLLHIILGIYAMLLGFLFIQGVIGGILGIVGLVAVGMGLTGQTGFYTLLFHPDHAAPSVASPSTQSPAEPENETKAVLEK